MPLSRDIYDIVDVTVIQNLANLSQSPPVLVIPAGLTPLFTTTVFNNFDSLSLASDLQQIATAAVVNPELTIVNTP